MSDWPEFTAACGEAMRLASESPGRYGGRYVAHKGDQIVVLDDDDPERYRNGGEDEVDILAHVQPEVVYPVGRMAACCDKEGVVTYG
jgi:hypothetical protein